MSEKETSTAYFIHLPFTIEDLQRPHLSEHRKPYVVEKTVWLSEIEYENFITDLCVDRWFIWENKQLCRVDEGGVWHCVLLMQEGRSDGILVMSEGEEFPKWAAYLPEV